MAFLVFILLPSSRGVCGWRNQCSRTMDLFEKHIVILLDEALKDNTASQSLLQGSKFYPWQIHIAKMSCFEEEEDMQRVPFLCGKLADYTSVSSKAASKPLKIRRHHKNCILSSKHLRSKYFLFESTAFF